MDVDDVIARHQARLNEHRKFLEASTAGDTRPPISPKADNSNVFQAATMVYPSDDTLFSPPPVQPPVEGHVDIPLPSFGVPVSPGGPQWRRAERDVDERPQRGQSAKSADDENRTHRRLKLGIYQSAPQGNPEPSYRKRIPQRGSHGEATNDDGFGTLYQSFSDPVASFSYRNIRNQLAEEDRFFDNQLKAAGRYCIARPDAMYTRSQLWLENRERSLQRLHEARLRESLEAEISPQRKRGSSAIVARRSHSARAALSICEDPSVAAHLERLEEARQRRVEAEQRAFGKEAGKWTNQLTVPKEFALGKKVTSIPSLRRPFVGVVPLYHEKETKEKDEPHASRDSVSVSKPKASQQQHQEKTNEGQDPAERVNVHKPVKKKDVNAIYKDDVCSSETLLTLKATIAQLQEELVKKDKMLQQQRGEMILLKRELEVAKATVRNISLRDVVVVEMEETTAPKSQSPINCEASGQESK